MSGGPALVEASLVASVAMGVAALLIGVRRRRFNNALRALAPTGRAKG